MPEKNEPLKLDFRNLIEKCDAKIVNPIRFEQKDSNGYPIWSFWLHDDDGLCSGCDYLLVSRLELIELIKSAVQGLINEMREKGKKIGKIRKGLNKKDEKERWYCEGYIQALSDTYESIKKWFADVVEG